MRSATLFLLVIFTPCALLCWVSWRWMQEEENTIKRDKTASYQQSADYAARAAAKFMTGQLQTFGENMDRLLAAESPGDLRLRFHQTVRGAFPLAEAGLVFDSTTGRILPQVEPSEQAVTAFVSDHAWFFSDDMQPLFLEIPFTDRPARKPVLKLATASFERVAEPASALDALSALAKDSEPSPSPPLPAAAPAATPANGPSAPSLAVPPAEPKNETVRDEPSDHQAPEGQPVDEDSRRTVRPAEPGPQSQIKPVLTRVATLIHDYETGIAGQTHDERLFTFFWYRPPSYPELTFAVALQPEALQNALAGELAIEAPDKDTNLTLLDHRLKPAAQWPRGAEFKPASWSSPLVAREVGAVLPRWEASVFLRDPAIFNHAASASRWRLGVIVTTASLAAFLGAFFILRDARRTARDARLKTDFVSNVSHELKTPLTSIRMFSDLLGNNPAVAPEKTKRYAEVIASEAARLTRLINNVLNFSRMESGRQQLKVAPLDLRALTAETMEHMRPQLEKDGFEVEVLLPEEPVMIQGDADALSQVLLNLLSNAGKYGTASDLPKSITVALTMKDRRAILSVADRGPGIPRGHERRVFEKFQRAHNTLASGTAGSGLGLTIARRLAEAHKGSLEYSSRTGGGAEFTLALNAG